MLYRFVNGISVGMHRDNVALYWRSFSPARVHHVLPIGSPADARRLAYVLLQYASSDSVLAGIGDVHLLYFHPNDYR